jgi:hypothetical protein
MALIVAMLFADDRLHPNKSENSLRNLNDTEQIKKLTKMTAFRATYPIISIIYALISGYRNKTLKPAFNIRGYYT